MNRPILPAVTLAFAALSALALYQHGYWGIFQVHLTNTAGAQVLADLVIALSLVLSWLRRDARKCGRPYWPWLLATLTLGSFGPLFYLLTRKEDNPPPLSL